VQEVSTNILAIGQVGDAYLLIQELLGFTSLHHETWHTAMASGGHDRLDAFEERVREWLRAQRALPLLDAAWITATLLEQGAEDRVLFAHAAAQAIHSFVGTGALGQLASRKSSVLTNGNLVLGGSPDLKKLFAQSLSPRPSSLQDEPDRIDGAWLFQQPQGCPPIEIDWSLGPQLQHILDHNESVWIAIPNIESSELGAGYLEGANEEAQGPIIDAMLREARRRKARVLVFPELSLTTELVEQSRAFLADGGFNGCLVVLGSAQRSDSGSGANVSTLALGDGVAIEHRKRAAFRSQTGERERIGQTLEPLKILAGGEWRVSHLICKDFFDTGLNLADGLEAAGANFVLVPARSDVLDPFNAPAEQLRSHCQAIVVLSNGPIRHGDKKVAAGLVAVPVRDKPIQRCDEIADGPFLAEFRLKDLQWTTVSVEVVTR
jgi:predicted amidohydrolase